MQKAHSIDASSRFGWGFFPHPKGNCGRLSRIYGRAAGNRRGHKNRSSRPSTRANGGNSSVLPHLPTRVMRSPKPSCKTKRGNGRSPNTKVMGGPAAFAVFFGGAGFEIPRPFSLPPILAASGDAPPNELIRDFRRTHQIPGRTTAPSSHHSITMYGPRLAGRGQPATCQRPPSPLFKTDDGRNWQAATDPEEAPRSEGEGTSTHRRAARLFFCRPPEAGGPRPPPGCQPEKSCHRIAQPFAPNHGVRAPTTAPGR